MSSGALLLKQLQARQRQQTARARVDLKRSYCDTSRVKATIDDTTCNQSAGSSTDTIDKEREVLDSQRFGECIDNANAPVTVEVCLGPDCSGGGGGAALLEIESLVMDRGEKAEKAGNSSKSNFRVIGGGCRDFCTMGPNVHIHSESFAAEDSHFIKVNCPEECRRVVRAATGTSSKGTCDDSTGKGGNSNNIAKILQLREDGRRWRVLRDQAVKERRLRVRERDKKSEG